MYKVKYFSFIKRVLIQYFTSAERVLRSAMTFFAPESLVSSSIFSVFKMPHRSAEHHVTTAV